MVKMEKWQRQALDALIDNGLVTQRPHPFYHLWIYNYTQRAMQIAPDDWSEELSMARGLILDAEGHIIARPFRKFWNYDDQRIHLTPLHIYSGAMGTVRPPDHVWEKMDGSLIIMARYNDARIVASRGSFTSTQARGATAFLDKIHPTVMPDEGVTYLFEWIAPDNRIVVDYQGKTDLVLLATIDNETEATVPASYDTRFTRPSRLLYDTPESAARQANRIPGHRAEGFVLEWEGRFGSLPYRVKVKSEAYKALHRAIWSTSIKKIWEVLVNGGAVAVPVGVSPKSPLGGWFKHISNTMNHRFCEIYADAFDGFQDAVGMLDKGHTRKEVAAVVKQLQYPGLVFALIDDKDIDRRVWNIVLEEFPNRYPALVEPPRNGGDDGSSDSATKHTTSSATLWN